MEKARNVFNLIFQYFFLFSLIVLILIYVGWFRVAPIGTSFDNLILGLFPLSLFIGSVALLLLFKKQRFLKTLILIPSTVFLALNILYVTIAAPKVMDTAIFNGSIYYLIHSHEPFDPVYEGFTLTKWKWGLIPEAIGMPGRYGIERLRYDKTMRVLNVVRVFDDVEVLVYSEGKEDSRFYDSGDRYGDHLYYPSVSKCIKEVEDYPPCEIYFYQIFQCGLDNTACIPIPFRYIGEGDYAYMQFNETTNEIDLYVGYWENGRTPPELLIYSYGDAPRCYVDGCEILPSP